MKITPNQPFLHDKERYEPDVEYDVPEGLGTYFVLNGWAASDTVLTGDAPAAVDLEVQDNVQDQKAQV